MILLSWVSLEVILLIKCLLKEATQRFQEIVLELKQGKSMIKAIIISLLYLEDPADKSHKLCLEKKSIQFRNRTEGMQTYP